VDFSRHHNFAYVGRNMGVTRRVASGRQKTEAIMSHNRDPDPYDPKARTGFRSDEPQHWNAIWGWIATVAALVIIAALMVMTTTEINVATNTRDQLSASAPNPPANSPAIPPAKTPANPGSAR
jgi:hypothetical protein